MTKHILINLDEPQFAPSCDLTLLEIIRSGTFSWFTGATCVTQERDGELLWWSAPVGEVKKARSNADIEAGLMPIIGVGFVVQADYFLQQEQEVVAKDWQTSVVTIDQFTGVDS